METDERKEIFMDNGIFAAVKDNRGVCAFFVDQESLELRCLNSKSRANRQKLEREQAEQQAITESANKAQEIRKRRFHHFVVRTIKHEAILAATMALICGGVYAEQVSIYFAVPIMNVLFALFCFNAGIFCCRVFRRRR